jgi:NADH dehydrogenase/NADH:ubiquinone oxidoreductase subunit G
MIRIFVNDRELKVQEGRALLQVCLENDIFIPNLCFLEEMESPAASCRLCFVAIEGQDHPVTSCTVAVKEGMRVRTDTTEVRRLQKSGLRLLLSAHEIDCRHCPAHKACELQRIAGFLKMKLVSRPLAKMLKEEEVDRSHPCLDYYPNRCVLCAKCVFVCRQGQGCNMLTLAKRGFAATISSYSSEARTDNACEDCRACVNICPVGALVLKARQSAA